MISVDCYTEAVQFTERSQLAAPPRAKAMREPCNEFLRVLLRYSPFLLSLTLTASLDYLPVSSVRASYIWGAEGTAIATNIQSFKEPLSQYASVDLRGGPEFEKNTARWSDFQALLPGTIINVYGQEDIAAQSVLYPALPSSFSFLSPSFPSPPQHTLVSIQPSDRTLVKFAVLNNIPFTAQCGVHGCGSESYF